MIDVAESGDEHHAMWAALIDLARDAPAPWVLIGAHMVALHGWARGREQIRPSRDADVLVDVRMVTDGTARLAGALVGRGYQFEGMSRDGIGHRFERDGVRIDILAPDGLGERAILTTVGSARTVRVPAGTQALRRAEQFEIRSRNEGGVVPAPSLLGALLVKVRAIKVDDQPDAQRRDVAFLLSLVDDPDALGADLSPTERGWLRRHLYLSNPEHTSYRGIEGAEDATIAFRRLAEVP